uniref:Uncharacterized protein n=1 Tax=Tanacetum cinerariifolium TaxID=118510 RepID=A0A6L2LA99_TANCI|nr:hypothetical protein [Tanacetum cinerariifolium]
MAKENVPAPIRTDEQLVPVKARLPIGKSNLFMDLQKMQKNPIFHISLDLLQNTNFFSAFTASADNSSGKSSFRQSRPFFSDAANLKVLTKKPKPHVIPYCRFTKLIICYLGGRHNIHKRPRSPLQITADNYLLGNLKFIPKGELDEVFIMAIPKDLITDVICNSKYYQKYLDMAARKPRQATTVTDEEDGKKKKAPPASIQMSLESFQAPVGGVAICEPDSGISQKLPVVKGKRKVIASNELAAQSLLDLQKPKNKNDTFANVVHDTPSPVDAETGANLKKSNNKADTRILNVGEEQDEPKNANIETKVESMVTVPMHQASLSAPPLSTPIIDLLPPKTVSSPTQAPIFTATTATIITLPLLQPPQQKNTTDPKLANRVSAPKKICANSEKINKLHDKNTQALSSRVSTLENYDLKSGSYRSHPDHATLYEALELSMDRKNREEFIEAMAKSSWKTFDTREAPSSSSKQKSASPSEQPVDDVSIPDDVHLSDSKDTGAAHLLKINTRPDWLKPLPEEEAPETPKPDWVIPPNDLPETGKNWVDALAKTYKDPKENKLIWKTRDMGTFINWYCKQIGNSKLVKADLEGPGYNAVKSHMKILSVVSHKTFSRYCYTYLKEIVLRIADYKEYKILEADFKNLHPNDFEDLYQLQLQGKLNHLSGADKVHLFNAINLWIRNKKKMMRETEVHKFSDGTLTRILEKLDFMIKDYELFKFNPVMEHMIWSKNDKRRSQEFIKLIQRRLKIRRIFKSLESFVSGGLRYVDYRLIQRTK